MGIPLGGRVENAPHPGGPVGTRDSPPASPARCAASLRGTAGWRLSPKARGCRPSQDRARGGARLGTSVTWNLVGARPAPPLDYRAEFVRASSRSPRTPTAQSQGPKQHAWAEPAIPVAYLPTGSSSGSTTTSTSVIWRQATRASAVATTFSSPRFGPRRTSTLYRPAGSGRPK